MRIYKGYIKNRDRIEGCIINRYIIEEFISFYTDYMRGLEAISYKEVGNDEEEETIVHGRPMSTSELFNLDPISLEQAHRCVLLNMDEV